MFEIFLKITTKHELKFELKFETFDVPSDKVIQDDYIFFNKNK